MTRTWEPLPPCSDCMDIVAQLNRRMPQLYQSLATDEEFALKIIPDVDGHVAAYNPAGSVWNDLYGGAGTASEEAVVEIWITIRCDGIANKWDLFRRGVMILDMSGIPTGATIISVDLILFGANVGTLNKNDFTSELVCVNTTTIADDGLEAADYDGVGENCDELTPRLALADWGIAGQNVMYFNETGVAHAQTKIGGYMKLGLIISHDYDDDEPTWADADEGTVKPSSKENTSYQPSHILVRYRE